MYTPAIFAESNPDEIKRLIADHPLASIVYTSDEGVQAQHAPLIFDGENRLIGHLAASNEMASLLANDSQVLAIFSGQNAYISPNWYPSKAQHHQHVPTWNYQKVHIYGRIYFLTDEKSARAIVGKLTKHFESVANGINAWKMSDAPKEYMDEMLRQITPFEISVDRVSAKSKLSQNRSDTDYYAVIRRLESNDRLNETHELVQRMKSLKKS